MAGCTADTSAPAKLWTVQDFLDAQGKGKDFGGFTPEDLLVPEGQPLRFLPGTQVGGPGLTLFPAVASGDAAAYVITDLWQAAPAPWVQPVWAPRDAEGRPLEGALSVFPVDVDSTFYSPYWRMEELPTPGLTPETYRSARDVLNRGVTAKKGSIVFCPIVPEATRFADDGSGVKFPTTEVAVTLKPTPPQAHPGWLPLSVNQGWVDGARVHYLDFGADHAPFEGQVVFEADAYFFVRRAGDAPLPLATVLPEEPLRHALVRRVDVVLPPGAAPFVPPSRQDLRARLLEKDPGLNVPELTEPRFDGFPAYALRVALDARCFDEPTFPASCDWLDAPARVRRLRSDLLVRTDVQLGIGVLLP